MSSAQFDPCRQWLGIDAVELGDPRRVLGLLPSEADPLVVLRAADARLTLLRSIAPGPFDMARNALIKRVEESREAVLAQIAAAPKPPVPVGATFSMPPPPDGVARVPQAPQMTGFPPVPDNGNEEGFVAVRTRPAHRKRSGGAGGFLLLLVLAAAIGGFAWLRKNDVQLSDVLSAPGVGVKKAAATVELAAKPPRLEQPEQVLPTEPEPEPEPTADPPDNHPEPPPATEEPASTENPDAATTDAATTDEADADAIVPFLKKAVAALQDGQFDDADDALRQAGDEAMGRAAADRLAQWQALVTYAKGFADLRDQALDAARPGLEYEIDGKRVAIVELDQSKIIYRYAGKNKTLPRSRIPNKLMLAIMEKWLNRKPANHLYLGAYHATKPEPDLDKAREAWHLAERGGADASELLPLLDDPVLMKAAGAATGRDDQ